MCICSTVAAAYMPVILQAICFGLPQCALQLLQNPALTHHCQHGLEGVEGDTSGVQAPGQA